MLFYRQTLQFRLFVLNGLVNRAKFLDNFLCCLANQGDCIHDGQHHEQQQKTVSMALTLSKLIIIETLFSLPFIELIANAY